MIETERSGERIVDLETVRQSIALSYVKAWIDLQPGPARLLGTVLPFLGAQDPSEDPAIRLSAAALDNHPDAHRKAWKGLRNAACAVHESKVEHTWFRWNAETEREVRCFANLSWTTEVRVDPVLREVELVFWPRLLDYLPRVLVPMRKFENRPLQVTLTPSANRSLTDYFHDRQP